MRDRSKPIGPGHPVYGEVVEFLYQEAELLDTGRFRDWLALMTEDLSYRMPVRVTRVGRKQKDYSDEMEIFSDDLSSMRLRVDRLATGSAWAEDPPSRTRHLVSDILCAEHSALLSKEDAEIVGPP